MDVSAFDDRPDEITSCVWRALAVLYPHHPSPPPSSSHPHPFLYYCPPLSRLFLARVWVWRRNKTDLEAVQK